MSDARKRARLVPLQPAAGAQLFASAVEIRRAGIRRREIFLCGGVEPASAKGNGTDCAAPDGAQRAHRTATLRSGRPEERDNSAQSGRGVSAGAQGEVGRGMVAVKWLVALWLAASAEDTHAH